MRRRRLSFDVLLCAALACAVLAWTAAAAIGSESSPPGIFVLGIDGVDPVILERMMGEGRMPHFARLAREGSFQRLGTSTRTLQRRLNQEKKSFQGVLNETREDLARHYLKSSDMTGAEISFLLGFEDPNSFFRAFHTWTGETPEQARGALQASVN